eukprot:3034338-Amphidinium_carterae.1
MMQRLEDGTAWTLCRALEMHKALSCEHHLLVSAACCHRAGYGALQSSVKSLLIFWLAQAGKKPDSLELNPRLMQAAVPP